MRPWKTGLPVFGLALIGVGLASCAPGDPNVVLVVVDTLRADRLGCYGYETDTSPSIDELARRSHLFEHAYATAPWTTPSVASIFTGRYPRSVGIVDREIGLNDELVTLAELFKRRGYRTKGIVSHLFIDERLGFAQGFDGYNAREAGHGRSYVSSPGVTEKAIRFIHRKGDGLFFLFVHYFDPHYDYLMHAILNTYPEYKGRLLTDDAKISNLRELSKERELSQSDRRYLDALYDSEVRFTDHNVGRLLDALKQRGLYEDAMIVFAADHGEELGTAPDGWVGHTKRLSQEMIRVPLMIKMPGQKRGRRVPTPVSLVDLMPTLVKAVGMPMPAGVEGRPIQIGNEEASARPVFAETRREALLDMVVSGRWKLVYDREKEEHRLFDVVAAPTGREDVDGEHPEVVAALEVERARWSAAQEQASARWEAEDLRDPVFTEEEERQLRELGYVR
jgi:arylsulfatase A-like enzyme